MLVRNHVIATLCGLVLSVAYGSVGISQDGAAMQKSAETLTTTLRKTGKKTVAVVPLLFVEDRSTEQIARENAQYNSGVKVERARPVLSASMDSLRLAEQMQGLLSQAGQGDFGVVPAENLFERILESEEKTQNLTPSSKDLASILNPEGDIEALVVGTIRKKLAEIKHANGGTMLGDELVACDWQVLDPSKSTILVSDLSEPGYGSLAEAVYNGLSVEYFRYQNGRLTCLLDYVAKDRQEVPLRPSDPEIRYNKNYIFNSRVHPLLNPNCPLKVQFEVGDRILPVHVAESEVFYGKDILPPAVVNLEPGDEPIIRVSNTLPKRVIVAVFIDGINILGKKREIPNEACHAWVLEPNQKMAFKSWWNIENKKQVEEERFVIQDWAESVAGKMGMRGDADSSRAITVVFYTDDFADRNSLAFFERAWLQRWDLTSNRPNYRVTERLVDPNNLGAAPNMFGMGAKKAVPSQLRWVSDAKVGTMLASMTVWYCPSADTKRMFTQLLEKNQASKGRQFSIVPISSGR